MNLSSSLLWLTIAEALYNLSGYAIHAVAGRVLGPEDYGRYALVITLTTTLIILVGNGIPTAMSRFLSEHFEHSPERVAAIKRSGIRLQLILIGSLTSLFFLMAPLIARGLGDPTLTPLFRISSLIIPAFAASSFYFYYFTGIHRFEIQAILKMARAILRVVVTVPFVFFFGIIGAIVGYVVVPSLTFLLGLFFDRKYSKPFRNATKLSPDISPFPWKSVLRTALPITAFLVSYEILVSADLYLVKRLLDDDGATGIYSAALTLSRIPHYLFYALSIVILPTLAKLKSENDPAKVTSVLGNTLRWSGIILFPLAILLIAYAEPATRLFFGEHFAASADPLRILVPGLAFLTVFYVICTGLIGLGYAKLVAILTFVGTLANIVANILLIPIYGIIGAAWATSSVALLLTIVTLLMLRRYFPLPFRGFVLAKILFAGALLFFGAISLPASPLFFLFPATLLGIAFVGILFALGVLTQEDIRTLLPQKKKSPEKTE